MKTITISRQYGSGGRYIAALLSEKMGVPCYDSKFLPKEAERKPPTRAFCIISLWICPET